MSDRRLRCPVAPALAALAVVACSTLATAQARPANIDSLRGEARRLDSIAAEQSRIVDSVRRSLVRPVPPLTVRGGALEVRTVAELQSRVRVAVDSVAGLIEREGGAQLAARVAAHVPVVRPDSARALFTTVRVVSIAPDTSRRAAPRVRQSALATGSARQIEHDLVGVVEQFAAEGIDSTLSAWLMTSRIPLRATSSGELGDAYTELATTESAAIRRCRSGDTASCLDILGIDSLPGSRLERWYSPDDYRALLRIVVPPREDSVAVAAWVRCRERRDESACRAVATALPNDRIPIPVSALARRIFLREVLEVGGTGAYGRLVDSTGPVRKRFELVASQPVDVIVSRWRDRVEDARPDRMTVPPTLALASLGWSGALLGLTLLRRRP